MKFLRGLGRFLISAWFLIPFVTLILSLCVWFFAPWIGSGDWHPFDGVLARVLFIAALWIIALIWMLVLVMVRAGRDRQLEKDIVEAVDDKAENEVVVAELAELRGKLKGAMAALRKSKTGRKHLYDLPWYVMIGPPGAGKTTAILNSGLQFPVAEGGEKASIGGVGGTRNCDWWFTENAVMIDTAGRYTTQESDAEADNAGWLGFLGLLKKHRTRQPINGALIAISLSDLSLQDEATQKGHARAVRRRLAELRERLGVRFPVYVLFTKADMIAGFSEFFDTLGKEEREQVWGFTLPLPKGRSDASPIAAFDDEFSGLLGQLNAQLLDRMQGETDHQRRSMIAGFPVQVASLRAVARGFLAEVFQDSKFEDRHLLRGLYFTSGTQEGTPIDRLMMGMARTFGIGRQAIGSGRGTGRSYFLTKLFMEVVFPEAGLVSADDRVERRYRWTVRGAIAATVIFAALASALWVRSYLRNQDLMASVAVGIADFQAKAAVIPGNPVGDTDLPSIVGALNVLRNLPVNPIPPLVDPAAPDPGSPDGAMQWGLYQGNAIANQTGQSYRAALNNLMLPRILLRLEEQIQGNINNADILYEALKVYLMLGLQGPMNSQLVTDWMGVDWELSYPGPDRAQMRADLAFHLNALLSQPMQEVALNGPLVDQVQALLVQMPIAQRVYSGIINTAAATALPQWRVSVIGGPNVDRAMVRSSGKPLTEGIPGIFTYDGFNTVFKEQALGVAESIQRDSWVLGPRGQAAQTPAALAAITRDVLDLYYNDFIAQYDQLLGDLDIRPMASLQEAVEVTNILSGPTSPIVNILTSVDAETQLTVSRTVGDVGQAADLATNVVADEAIDQFSVRTRVLLEALSAAATANGEPPPPPPGRYVEERFVWLHKLVTRPEGAPSPLDGLMGILTEVYQDLNRISFRGNAASAPTTGGEALARLQEAVARIEGPLARWANQITTGGAGVTADGTRAGIDAAWKSSVLPFCSQAIASVYPFDRRAAADMGMADFAKLFGPDGLIDAFFKANLASIVDTSVSPWVWKAVNGADLGISPAVLEQMQNAATIRDAFFSAGPIPKVAFQITPVALDPNAELVQLIIDDTQIDFKQGSGQPPPAAVSWPGSVGVAQAGFAPPLAGGESVIRKEGPWGWFRLLDGAEVRSTNAPDKKRIIFNIGGRIAIFQMQTTSVLNPFALPALAKFSCPTSF